MITILVVEDEYGIAKLLEEVLEEEGYRVLLASNGQQGLDKATETRPDLVITDLMMPVMDGAALIQALTTHPDLSGIPIILMSAVPEEGASKRCSGYASFLRKPFKIMAVVDLVESLVAKEKDIASR